MSKFLYIDEASDAIVLVANESMPSHPFASGCLEVVVPTDFQHKVGYLNSEGEPRLREMTATELQEALTYKERRFSEYPPITDYIDGVVKGDQAQIDAYIAACQAVKDKYPKPQ